MMKVLTCDKMAGFEGRFVTALIGWSSARIGCLGSMSPCLCSIDFALLHFVQVGQAFRVAPSCHAVRSRLQDVLKRSLKDERCRKRGHWSMIVAGSWKAQHPSRRRISSFHCSFHDQPFRRLHEICTGPNVCLILFMYSFKINLNCQI